MGGLRSGWFVLATVGVLAVALPVRADDAAVRQRVEDRLEKAGLAQAGDVRVEVTNGTVTLTGAVTTVEARRQAERAARRESKVVENQLEVLPEPRSEAAIRAAVTAAVLRYPRYTVFDAVGFEVKEGVVVLRGSVLHAYRKDEIGRRVEETAGVRKVENEIKVQPTSIFDDRLRLQLVRAIYGDERFVQYAHRADPPIRIVVDRGRVTLYGTVASKVEQAVLGHIAREALAFGVDNQLEVEGEEPKEHPVPRTNEG